MLGTGSALVTRCYNTCFVVKDDEPLLLVDAGGGNGILSQLEKAKVNLSDIHDMFLTHAHTDHILGAVWVLRKVMKEMEEKHFEGMFRVYGHDRVLSVVENICRMTLPKRCLEWMGSRVLFCEVKDRDCFQVGGMSLQCFDILSAKEKQFGFRATLSDGVTLACLGDEPFQVENEELVKGVDWLMCEAFCLYQERDVFKPYEKKHSTALEAGQWAEKLGVKNLILYHTEDTHLDTRRQLYTAEASLHFQGNVVVPDDLDVIELS